MEKEKETTIDMLKYVNNEPIHDKCFGCRKVFDYVGPDGVFTERRCLTYIRPDMWWRKRSIATALVMVKTQMHPKGTLQELPVMEFRCPVATHVITAAAAVEAKLNPLKASKRARG